MTAPDTTQIPPEILTVVPDGIPMQMRALKRWVAWEAEWIPERGKYDKRPINPVTGTGASTRAPATWATFEQAYKSYLANPGTGKGKIAGIGFVIVKRDNIFCIDVDKCMPDGQPNTKAVDVISKVRSFTEYSPSGEGSHTWGFGEIDRDCGSGIEVYQGNGPRYVTVTGRVLAGAPSALVQVPTDVLQSIIDTYGARKSTADVIELQAPEILDPLVLPGIEDLGLPYTVADFLRDGDRGTKDRSLMLFQTAIALHNAGLNSQEVFSVMVNNPYAFGAALEKRPGDEDKAMDFLWVHQVQKAKPRSDATRITVDDFEDLSAPDLGEVDMGIPTSEPNGMFDDVSAQAGPRAETKPPQRFKFLQMAEFMRQTRHVSWLVHGVLPQAEVGVVFGDSGSGKSFFIFDLLMAVVRGDLWRGIKARQGNVAYVVAEGASGFPLRLQAYAEHHGIDPEQMPFYLVGDAPNLMEKADTKDLIQSLKALGKLDVVVLDTLAQVTPGADENSGQDMGRALAHCKAIHKITGAMVLLIAHTGKDASRGIRGWSGIKGALDVEILVEKAGHQRAATITKMKDGEGEGREYQFKLDVVKLGEYTDEAGEIREITSCVLSHGASQIKGEGPDKLTRQEHKDAMERLESIIAMAGPLPLATALDTIAGLQNHPELKNRNKAAGRILDVLIKARHVVVENDMVNLHGNA